MRIILHVIFFFFIVLIALENLIVSLIKRTTQTVKVTGKFIRKATTATSVRTKLFFHRIKRIRLWKKRRKKQKNPLSLPILAKVKYFFFGTIFAFFFLFLPLVVFIFLQDLPSPQQLSLRQVLQTTKIYDRNGILLTEIYSSQNRTLISLSEVPKSLQQATLAIEDKNFYNHPGFDIPSIVRAFREDILRNNKQGGSTLTQQLIKSSMLTPERSFSRKAKEIVLAFWAERIYTKNQILEMYVNQVPYGGTAWGVEAASETYFNKPVKELSLAESAFLAGLTAAPSYYSPYGNYPNAWKGRQKEVLKRMVAQRYITQKQADAAAKEELHFRKRQTALHAPHFTEYVKGVLIEKYGLAAVEKGGLSIITSIDLKKQETIEKIVAEEVAKSGSLNITNGAAVVTDPRNGDILAMVGSHDFEDPNGGNVNLTTSLRQPGSSIKVVTYAAALSTQGYTAASMLDDTPVTYPGAVEPYSPVNYDGRFHGRVSFRIALANSYNIPAVRLLDQMGVPTMVNLGKQMGITTWGDPKEYGLPLTLGAGEVKMLDMASVYGTLANNGWREDINPILKVTNATGSVLEEKTRKTGKQVLSPGVAFIMSDILADNNARSLAFGPNSPLVIPGHTVSVKTGTTDNKRDNWTDGYTDKYVVVVWVGNNDNTPMSPTMTSGITGAAPIWHKIMANLLKNTPDVKPTPPKEIVRKMCFGRPEYFIKGTENSVNCGFFTPPTSTYSSR